MSPEKFITIKNEPESDLSKVDVGKLTSLLEKYNVLFGMGLHWHDNSLIHPNRKI